jgi:hypothetical protein
MKKTASETAEWKVHPHAREHHGGSLERTVDRWNRDQLRTFLNHLAPDRLPTGRSGRMLVPLRAAAQEFIEENLEGHDASVLRWAF